MSTPRTDAVKIVCGFQAVPEPMLKHAQELERENAALRSDLSKCNNLSEIRRDAFYDEKSARWAMVDRMRELERENSALREALDSAIVLLRRWNKNDVNDDVVIETRKAIYAARKEAQP